MLIGLSGTAESGKSTVAKYLASKHGFVKSAHIKEPMVDMARPLIRHMCPDMSYDEIQARLDGDRKEEPLPGYPDITGRKILTAIGKDFRDAIQPDRLFFLQLWWEKHKGIDYLVNESVRYQVEADYFTQLGGHTIWIERPGARTSMSNHESEQKIKADIEVVNDAGLQDLYTKIDLIVNGWKALRPGIRLQEMVTTI